MSDSSPVAAKISVEGVTIRYAGRAGIGEVTAIEAVDLTIAVGEFVVIVGPSGCGKTTLLRAIGGLQGVLSGRITVAHSDPQRPASAMVFQGASVFPWLTVTENVAYGLRTRGLPYAERIERAREWIGRVGLTKFAEAYPHQLSGGMRQRVGLARAFAYDPEILLMDEPFGALDAQTRLILQETLLMLWQSSGATVVFVTHSIDEALSLADRVVIMSARPGRIIGEEQVTLSRPRQTVSLRQDPQYGTLFGRVWARLRDEVG
ncbi:MAG TPA: ABC transporter ATP-binding protein [Aggregatilineales bacterium]|nr:ABC transporter ATP-binding protein [Anaerolineales bacterium]HRE49024.1 ABC transporter ATP-binding protein [Aggregatilineales bacterium]